MKTTSLLCAAFLAGAFASSGCGSTETQPEYPPTEEAPEVAPPTPTETPSTEPATPPTPPAPPPITLTVGENSPIEGATPTIAIVAPRNNAVIRANQPIPLRIRLTRWELPAGGGGSHVHLIIDNQPYIRLDDVSHPLDLRALAQQNHIELSEGSHLIRVFPSRMSHESVKANGAFAMAIIHIGRRTPAAEWPFDPSAPLLTYSRPKGCYGGNDAQRLLVDFYVTNTRLVADGHFVRLSIDGHSIGDPISSWVPHYVTNLPLGEHTFVLELLDAAGAAIAGPFNRTERRITTRADACPAPAPAPAAAGAAAPTGHEGH